MSSNRNDIIIKELTAAHEAAKARLVDLQAEFAAARREEQRLRVARGVMSDNRWQYVIDPANNTGRWTIQLDGRAQTIDGPVMTVADFTPFRVRP